MSAGPPASGPLAGEPIPLHGGAPGAGGCNGCIDCCHLPEISVTDEEAARLRELFDLGEHRGERLVLNPDAANEGWQIMRGPCVFRRSESPLDAGGCAIYEDRPASCRIFTCRLLLELRRSAG